MKAEQPPWTKQGSLRASTEGNHGGGDGVSLVKTVLDLCPWEGVGS